ncbi:class I SAM-dependent methyltransferase [Desulfosporosinus shakirovi]|uniref:class I SAM-dependent methyltransferase n=1 Tax=Desulfosporosinus shakirovi TaxID=2885154 RepID=UPI001E454692|nr:class I SAM-dependent methyltransferase [Desulfosporosinus sp. SRJS8]MCB8817052.1 class I SAM-dependent methyltransferase [Desulfosporosinus sp. SRJS8]
MDFEYFDKLWSKDQASMEESRMGWDFRAKEFKENKSQEMVRNVIKFFMDKGMLNQGYDVIDIGCGAGKYALEFSKTAKSVTALDFSPKMLELARQNAAEEGVRNVEFLEMPWEGIDIDALGWRKKFDFAAAIMSPAINSRKSLEKLINVSKGYCFMSGHLDRHEQVKEQIEKDVLKREPRVIDYGRNVYCSFNSLWQAGIYPELAYYDMKRENVRSLEDAFSYYCSQFQGKNELSSEEKQEIKQYLTTISEGGIVKDRFQSKTVWLYWKNK